MADSTQAQVLALAYDLAGIRLHPEHLEDLAAEDRAIVDLALKAMAKALKDPIAKPLSAHWPPRG